MGKFSQIEKKFSRIEAKSVWKFSWKSLYQDSISKLQRLYMYILWKCLYWCVHFCTLIIHVCTMKFAYTHCTMPSSTGRSTNVICSRRNFLENFRSFWQIPSNRKNSLGSKQNLYQNFREKFLWGFDFKITAFLHVHSLEVSVLMCTQMYTFVHLSYMCTLWHLYTLIPQSTHPLKMTTARSRFHYLDENFLKFL